MIPTIEDLGRSTLSICYPLAKLTELLTRASVDGSVKTLLSLPMGDARRVCAGMMSRAQLVEWSAFSARRAKDYAANSYAASYGASNSAAYAAAASSANSYAADAANDAAYAAYDCAAAAAYAAAAAAYAASYAAAACAAESASKADHEIAIRDACRLLGWS